MQLLKVAVIRANPSKNESFERRNFSFQQGAYGDAVRAPLAERNADEAENYGVQMIALIRCF